ncbi:MAG: FIST C-terminal domain-containing protein [Cyclobacteriaceae bacterium]
MILSNPSIEQLVAELTPDSFHLLLVGEHASIDINELIARCDQKQVRIAGGIFPGIVSPEGKLDAAVIHRKFDFRTKCRIYKDIHLAVEIDFEDVAEGSKSALLFLDGLSENISGFLSNTYAYFWNRIRFIGGGCGSISLKQQPCIFSNEGFFENAAMMLFMENPVSIGVKHGWKQISGPYVVSAAEGNTIHEINWRPAFDVYKEVIKENKGQSINKENFFDIAKAFPFGIFKEGTEDIVRDPILTDEKSMTCVGEITNHSVVNILNGNNNDLIEGAREAAAEALASDNIEDILVIDCISRALFQEDNFHQETGIIMDMINSKNLSIPLEGVLSLGEISSYGDGYLEFFNKTIVVGAFLEHER